MPAELFHGDGEVFRPRRGDFHFVACHRMNQGEFLGVKSNGGDQRTLRLAGLDAVLILEVGQQQRAASISAVAADGQAPVAEMNANLMGASGVRPALHQGVAAKLLADLEGTSASGRWFFWG